MSETPNCPVCGADIVREEDDSYVCEVCGHIWDKEDD